MTLPERFFADCCGSAEIPASRRKRRDFILTVKSHVCKFCISQKKLILHRNRPYFFLNLFFKFYEKRVLIFEL